jgi:hypothetical protein
LEDTFAVFKQASTNVIVFDMLPVADIKRNVIASLNLSRAKVTDFETMMLAALLEYNSSITTLRLNDNQIGDNGMIALAAALR